MQQQYSVIPQQQQQQRILKNSVRQVRTQTFLANSTRPPMRTNNKQSVTMEFNNQQQTPITNYRQQQPPPVKQAGQIRNGAMKKNNSSK